MVDIPDGVALLCRNEEIDPASIYQASVMRKINRIIGKGNRQIKLKRGACRQKACRSLLSKQLQPLAPPDVGLP